MSNGMMCPICGKVWDDEDEVDACVMRHEDDGEIETGEEDDEVPGPKD